MSSIANRESARELLDRARVKVAAGDDDAAKRLVEKSLRLYETEQGRALLEHFVKYGPGSAAAIAVTRVLGAASHYKVMNLTTAATPAAVKKAYKALSLEVHPDRNHARGAEEAFKRLSEAYDKLSNANERAAYDNERRAKQAGEQSAYKQYHSQQQRSQQQQQQAAWDHAHRQQAGGSGEHPRNRPGAQWNAGGHTHRGDRTPAHERALEELAQLQREVRPSPHPNPDPDPRPKPNRRSRCSRSCSAR